VCLPYDGSLLISITSTSSPVDLLRLPEPDDALTICIIRTLNGEWKTVNGRQVYNLLPDITVNQHLPAPSDLVGTSWFDRDDGMFYVVVARA
jgi:hypothetical protein